MKRLVSLLLAVIMVMGLVACGKGISVVGFDDREIIYPNRVFP